jgi:hypothetical protein
MNDLGPRKIKKKEGGNSQSGTLLGPASKRKKKKVNK